MGTTTIRTTTTSTSSLESDIGQTIGTIVGSVIAVAFVSLAGFFGIRFFKRRNHEMAESPDVNPTYGDYEDYAEPVVEVEDSNMYYSEVYVEGTSRARDNNSLYGE